MCRAVVLSSDTLGLTVEAHVRAHRDARRGDGSSRYSPAQHRAKDTLEVLEFAGRLLAEAPTNLFAPLIDGAGRFLAQRVPTRQHLSLREGSGSRAPRHGLPEPNRS
jgi:hypothetical protein